MRRAEKSNSYGDATARALAGPLGIKLFAPSHSETVSVDLPAVAPPADVANEIVCHLRSILQHYPPFQQAMAQLRAHAEHRLDWSLGTPDAVLPEQLAPGSRYRNELHVVAESLARRFVDFPWWEWWLHQRAGEESDRPGRSFSVPPFWVTYDPLSLHIHVRAAPDRTWDDIRREINANAGPAWQQLRRSVAPAGRNRSPLKPFLAAVCLFFSDFLGWNPTEVAHCMEDILNLAAGESTTWETRKYSGDRQYRQWVHHFGDASYEPADLIGWPRQEQSYAPDKTVSRYLRSAHSLLRREGFGAGNFKSNP